MCRQSPGTCLQCTTIFLNLWKGSIRFKKEAAHQQQQKKQQMGNGM